MKPYETHCADRFHRWFFHLLFTTRPALPGPSTSAKISFALLFHHSFWWLSGSEKRKKFAVSRNRAKSPVLCFIRKIKRPVSYSCNKIYIKDMYRSVLTARHLTEFRHIPACCSRYFLIQCFPSMETIMYVDWNLLFSIWHRTKNMRHVLTRKGLRRIAKVCRSTRNISFHLRICRLRCHRKRKDRSFPFNFCTSVTLHKYDKEICPQYKNNIFCRISYYFI